MRGQILYGRWSAFTGSAHAFLDSLCGKLLIQFPLCDLTQHVRIEARDKNIRKRMQYEVNAVIKEVRGMNYSLDELKGYASSDPLIPLYRKIPAAGQTSVELLRRLRMYSDKLFLLESSRNDSSGDTIWGRYAYAAYAPALEISCLGHTITLTAGQASFSCQVAEPIEYLRVVIEQTKAAKLPDLPPFAGGFAGYFSYEYIHLSQPSCHFKTKNVDQTPDFHLMMFDKLFVLDRKTEDIYLICVVAAQKIEQSVREGEAILDGMARIVTQSLKGDELPDGSLRLLEDFSPLYSKTVYMQMVERAKQYIQKGEVAQIVLTNGASASAEGSLIDTFALLRQTDPTRYMCYFSTGDVQAAIASPEPILKLENGVVMTERLAGSYARGKTPKEDEMQAEALRTDPKAVDEHNMLVDDSRNEFGFVCRPGTVAVSHYLSIVRCARVMHLGSTITGTLKPEMGALDVVNAIMPSGAVSGAPKIRACEIINEIEGERRGIYGSAVGYIGFEGNADFFAFIHSAFLKNGRLTVRAGGGIVIDSDPREEYQEAKVKAEAMLQTVKLAAKEEEHGSYY